MENTEKVLFEDDTPQWYIALGDKWTGPLSASDVYERVLSQQISWAHFVWKPGQAEWKRLCDVKTFKAAVPSLPAKKLQNEVKEVSKPNVRSSAKQTAVSGSGRKTLSQQERAWFLYYNDSQFGPFTEEEINRFLSIGKINERVHAWRSGMGNWTRLQDIEVFGSQPSPAPVREVTKAGSHSQGRGGAQSSKQFSDSSSARPEKTKTQSRPPEQREAPRRPMVAKILLHNNRSVTEAVCRDISVGGMQVLTDAIPGAVGSKIRLNVSSGSIDPFVAEGEIVRILEDSRGFSFRFSGLSDTAKKAIEKYIVS